MADYTIRYVLAIPGLREGIGPEYTLLQGHRRDLIGYGTALRKIACLAGKIVEAWEGRQFVANARAAGMSKFLVVPLEVDLLETHLRASLEHPFICLISDNKTICQVTQFLKKFQHPALHLTTSSNHKGGAISIEDAQKRHFKEYMRKVAQHCGKHGRSDLEQEFNSWVSRARRPKAPIRQSVERIEWVHNLTDPNELVLKNCGFISSESRQWFAAPPDSNSAKVIKSASIILADYRQKLLQQPTGPAYFERTSLILATPDPYGHLRPMRVTKRAFGALTDDDVRSLGMVYKSTLNQSHYHLEVLSTAVLEVAMNSDRATGTGLLLSDRKDEQAFFTSMLTIKAAENCCPAIRVRPMLPEVRGLLRHLGDCSRGRGPHRQVKVSQLARKIAVHLRASMGDLFPENFKSAHRHVKLLTDAPLELSDLEGLPLGLRFPVSRIPATPGALSARLWLNSDEIQVPAASLREVLIIRCFHSDDGIRNDLVKRLDMVHNAGLNITVTNVATRHDFEQALNGFRGGILVFDGHGSHDISTNIGGLMLFGEGPDETRELRKTDIWDLRGRVRIPPIVLLSACDTSPYDRSHANVANGFLAIGAKTVLGTILPVRSVDSAVLMVRLLKRIADFVPIVARHRPIRWVEVMSGMLRMQYATDILNITGSHGRFPMLRMGSELFARCLFSANVIINTKNGAGPGWYEAVLQSWAALLSCSPDELDQIRLKEAYFTEALKYVQLGNPEDILIVGEDGVSDYFRPHKN